MNDFLWKIFSINCVNYTGLSGLYNCLITLSVLVYFWSVHQNGLLTLITLSSYPFWVIVTYPVLHPRLTIATWLHLLLLMFFSLAVFNSVFVLNRWDLTLLHPLTEFSPPSYEIFGVVKLGSHFIEVLNCTLLGNDLVNTFNFLLSDTTEEIYSFFFTMTGTFQAQSLVLGNLVLRYTVNTYDFSSQSLAELFLAWLIFVLWRGRKKELIVF